METLEKDISREFRSAFVGKTVRVLAEEEKDGLFEGLSDEYIRVRIQGAQVRRGGLYRVRIESVTENGLTGTAEEEL